MMKLNHKGSTLLMVIICIAVLGILGTLMLSVSMVNLQMKRVQNKSHDNFYSCETALEEIKAGLEEFTANQIKLAYEYVLENYVLYETMDDTARNEEVQTLVMNQITAALGSDVTKIPGILDDYLSASTKDYLTIIITDIEVQKTTVPYTLVLKDVKLIYLDSNNYSTSLTSDIKITLPSFTFTNSEDKVTYSIKQPYAEYALVADGEIQSKNSTGINSITGNAYAGTGITIQDSGVAMHHKVTMNGKYIITRGDIKVINTAGLTIGNSIRPLLWANNIVTQTTGSYPIITSLTTDLNINAITLLQDDLSIDGRNSKVVFTGAMVGYSSGYDKIAQSHTASGSAILINGSGSSLDLSGIESLILAGRAHISVMDSLSAGIKADPNVNIMTGESLAFKSNQRAYLVPGEFIHLVKGTTTNQVALHNPITQKDLLVGTPNVDITSTTDVTKVNCFQYILTDPQFKEAAKQTTAGSSSTLRYFYLNFKSGQMADQYLVDYMSKYPKALQILDAFSLNSVKLPAAEKIVSAGNVMYYDAASSPTAPVKLLQGKSSSYSDDQTLDNWLAALKFSDINNNSVFNNTGLQDRTIGELPDLYKNITHSLSSLTTANQYLPEDKLVASTLIKTGVAQVNSSYLGGYTPANTGFTYYGSLPGNVWNNTVSDQKAIVILKGNAEIAANSYFNGILIASGNITIGEGTVINGLIIAEGDESSVGNVVLQNNVQVHGRIVGGNDIILGENCTIDCTGKTTFDSSLAVENFLMNLFKSDGDLLWRLFQNPEVTVNLNNGSTATDLVSIQNLVTIENWRMN